MSASREKSKAPDKHAAAVNRILGELETHKKDGHGFVGYNAATKQLLESLIAEHIRWQGSDLLYRATRFRRSADPKAKLRLSLEQERMKTYECDQAILRLRGNEAIMKNPEKDDTWLKAMAKRQQHWLQFFLLSVDIMQLEAKAAHGGEKEEYLEMLRMEQEMLYNDHRKKILRLKLIREDKPVPLELTRTLKSSLRQAHVEDMLKGKDEEADHVDHLLAFQIAREQLARLSGKESGDHDLPVPSEPMYTYEWDVIGTSHPDKYGLAKHRIARPSAGLGETFAQAIGGQRKGSYGNVYNFPSAQPSPLPPPQIPQGRTSATDDSNGSRPPSPPQRGTAAFTKHPSQSATSLISAQSPGYFQEWQPNRMPKTPTAQLPPGDNTSAFSSDESEGGWSTLKRRAKKVIPTGRSRTSSDASIRGRKQHRRGGSQVGGSR